MTSSDAAANPPGDQIDLNDEAVVTRWAQELQVSADQIREAVGAVGPLASDVELHLKGSRSVTNAERVDEND